MKNNNRNGVVHPKNGEKEVIKPGDLASAASTRSITWIPEAQCQFISHETSATTVQARFEEDQDAHVYCEGMDMMY
jgi:hypothetical protein